MNKLFIKNLMEKYLKIKFGVSFDKANEDEIFSALSSALMESLIDNWNNTEEVYGGHKNAYYLSAEYLMGRALGNNLISLGVYDEVKELLEELNIDINAIEESEEDASLGNGGLGRLAACFIDSAAAMQVPLKGYGIRYSNGLFKQKFKNGFQCEVADSWLTHGDPWSIRKEREAVNIKFSDMEVKAVPYDTPIIGYGSNNINTLRLWKCESYEAFDFNLYNDGQYDEALSKKNRAHDISRVLYPNDNNDGGKILRLKQQYFLVSASLQDIIKNHVKKHGNNFDGFSKYHVIQLNDTHPVLAIPEFIRIVVDEHGVPMEEALDISKNIFGYTNHTILAEALEQWNLSLVEFLFPRILEIIKIIDEKFIVTLRESGHSEDEIEYFKIIKNGKVRMANLAIHMGFAVNGVAKLHTDILKKIELKKWYELYPNKFQNKTNGITPRRWLRSCNKELAALITELLGSEIWVKDLSELKKLEKFANDEVVLRRFMDIKHEKKVQLANYIKEHDGIEIDPNSLFDIQIKRLHEYKRQLLNTLYILDLYYRLKEDKTLDVPKTTFIYGAKAFPGYKRAKAIIKFTNDVADLINNDKEIDGRIKVVFVENYRVSYAEKLFTAADVSKQISTAGKEASGTGNMKFMLNGTPTVGTYDGANVEIVRESGEENNFIFGLRVEDIEKIKETYNSKEYYENNNSLKKVIDTLIDGTFDDEETGYYEDLYNSLVNENDQYFILADFDKLKKAEEEVFEAYKDEMKWAKICFENTCNAGIFSSDRTIMEYCKDIWNINSYRNLK